MEKKYRIDYLSFTKKDITSLEELKKDFFILNYDFKKSPRGALGYKKMYIYKNIRVFADGEKDMGVHVEITGKGLDFLTSEKKLEKLLKKIKEKECKISRLDLACDFQDFGLLEKIKIAVAEKNVKTRFKSYTSISKEKIFTKEKQGETLYFGSRTSEVFIRAYDKALEKRLKDKDITRIELEIKGSAACSAFDLLEWTTIKLIFEATLNNYLDFIDRTQSTNVSRCPRLKWWSEALDCNAEKIQLVGSYAEKTIQEKRDWLLKTCAKTFSQVMATESDFDKIFKEVGFSKLDDSDLALIEDYIKEKNLL